ncbi:flagellar basal body protein FliL [Swingsia samuiensis]|uniref:Flagellar protein FliL n=1 Tax=Swingsia samuiensis TaxID=1293412 RepID=A0A4Y6ULS9_9PROT|nr:flagellar basal body protein FliL [Swingsia samuiensis]
METKIEEGEEPKKGNKKRSLIFLIAALCVLAAGGGAWKHFYHSVSSAKTKTLVDEQKKVIVIPAVMSNLDSSDGYTHYVRVSARLLVPERINTADVEAYMPQIQDLFQMYLHSTRLQELSGEGIYRLRESMLQQIQNTLAPIPVEDLFFVEVIVQ